MNPKDPTNHSEYSSAGLGRYLAAMFYDFLLLLGIILSTAIIIPAILTAIGSQTAVQEGQIVHQVEPFIDAAFFQVYFVLVISFFYCWFWRKNGQTLGMQSWRLKLITTNDEKVSLKHCLLRLTGASISLLCFGLGYLWIYLDKDKRSWHDRLSKTRLIVLPKQKK
jgi:uncharacterized RDD family membrane protein YckC